MRSQVALAVKGNGPTQRAMIAAIHAMEQELAAETAEREEAAPRMPYTESARRIALLIGLAYQEKGDSMPRNLDDAVAGLVGTDKPKTGG